MVSLHLRNWNARTKQEWLPRNQTATARQHRGLDLAKGVFLFNGTTSNSPALVKAAWEAILPINEIVKMGIDGKFKPPCFDLPYILDAFAPADSPPADKLQDFDVFVLQIGQPQTVRIPFRQVAPRSARTEHPKDTVQDGTPILPGTPSPVLAARWFGDEEI
jgi:hypothetical protein